ncbi:MAG TPA: homocysteine S-methyltransferase family protein [Rubellimicrobium sp.]|nr:homocysteine S-methyltransferase family protein [Rubellimicrobium sp.]
MAGITLLDGGMGQELVARSGDEPTPLWATWVMIDHPELVRAIHDDYFAAGATIATTNTYAIHHDRLERFGLDDRFKELHRAALAAATAARDDHGSGRIAGSIGPLVATYRDDVVFPVEEAAPKVAEVAGLLAPDVDLILLETLSTVTQAEGALKGAVQAGKPVWLSVSVHDRHGDRLRSGEPLQDLQPLVETYGPEAVLANCSVPEAMADALAVLGTFGRPFGAYANGFTHISDGFLEDAPTVAALTHRHDLTPERYADFTLGWVGQGATIVGGCCEVGPAHIAELARRLREAGHEII